MSAILGIVIGLLSLGLMMLLHELGHFLVGLKLGFKIIEFSIFMGPRLLSKEINGIRYSLKLLPIGASVQFAGEYPESDEELQESSDSEGHFYFMPIWKRALVLFAGPFTNIVSAFLALIIYFNIVGVNTSKLVAVQENSLLHEAGVSQGDLIKTIDGRKIRNELDLLSLELLSAGKKDFTVEFINSSGEDKQVTIDRTGYDRYSLGVVIDSQTEQGQVLVKSLAENSVEGIEAGDIIKKINSQPADAKTIADILGASKGKEVELELERNGKSLSLKVSPIVSSNVTRPVGAEFERIKSPIQTIKYSFDYSVSIVRSTFEILGRVITGGVKPSQALSGPVGIVDMYSGLVAAPSIDWELKFLQLLYLFALISMSLGIMNLLPIPPLDGSHLFFLIIEKIRGKKLSVKAMGIISMIGISLILLLAFASLGFDVLRIVKRG